MKRIGITTHVEHVKKHVENAISMDYIRAVIEAGGLPILIPVTLDFGMLEDYLDFVDGIIFTGGCDINPIRYGEVNEGLSVDLCDERDQMELFLLKGAIDRGIPVLGICRGMQLMNVFYGGSLYQDLMTQYNTEIDHINLEAETDYLAHTVKITPESRLSQWLRESPVKVNSRHHQAVKRLGRDLVICGRSKDGVVEAIEHMHAHVIGVQWHPEDLIHMDNRVFVAFVDSCKGHRRDEE